MRKSLIVSIVFVLYSVSGYCQDTIVLQPGPDEGKDAKTRLLSPDTNYGNGNDLTAHATSVLGPNISRSYFYFDLSFIDESTPIARAYLSLYIDAGLPNYPPGQSGSNESYIEMIIEDWDEHLITYNNAPSATTENQVYLPESTHNLQNYDSIDVTVLVQEMIANPGADFGFMLRLITEEPVRTLCFASSDYGIDSLRPKLTIIKDCGMPVSAFSYEREGDSFHFIDESDSAGSWHWDFGDGSLSNLQNPVYQYLEYGKYQVCLTVDNECGSSEYCDTINYCALSNAYFQYSISGDTVNFINLSAYSDSWYWDFGDGYGTTIENPFHYYNEPGLYTVCLTAENECGTNDFCDTLNLTGIDDPAEDKLSVVMFPNPSHGKLNLRIEGNHIEIDLVRIYDITGKEVYKINGPLHTAFNIGSLKEGIYLVRIFSDKRVSTKKLQLIY